jgi:protoporphyrin/coproporphyrin ferrochelatase
VTAGVLLLAHGAPERVEDVPEYLSYVRGGQPVAPRVVEEVASRYREIGGSSPLSRWTRVQAEALAKLLGVPVFFGMRNWHPLIKDTMEQVRAAGVARLACVCLAPQFAELSVGLYMKRTQEVAEGIELRWAKSYHDEPLLIEAFAERLRGARGRVIFTAHSLPAPNGQYDRQCRQTAALVAARAGIADYDFAYQSQGMSGGEWLGPTVESWLDSYADVKEVTVAPIGFVCDHVEILYDVDVQFQRYAAQKGIALGRIESLNGSETFTRALAEVAKRCLA